LIFFRTIVDPEGVGNILKYPGETENILRYKLYKEDPSTPTIKVNVVFRWYKSRDQRLTLECGGSLETDEGGLNLEFLEGYEKFTHF
jgi:hypothetical protein